jgi:hypothetical protein
MPDNKITLDTLLSLINSMDWLNPEEKKDLRKNCEYAIQQFGDNWIDNEDNRKHPLWGISALGELGSALISLQSEEHFSEILDRLRSADEFNGAYSEIVIGYWLQKSGTPFKFLKPKKKGKSPDIEVNSSRFHFIIEITTKEYPEDYLKVFQNYRKISYLLMSNSNGLSYSLKNHRPLISSATTDEIIQSCEDLLEKAKNSGFEELHMSKIIDLYLFRQENYERVPKKYRGFHFKFPKFDEYARVRGTIKQKTRQLTHDLPGVLLIFDSLVFPSQNIGYYTLKLRHELEETIFEFPKLSALVIITQFGDTSGDYRNITKENDSSISIRTYDPKTGISKYKVVIFNKYARFPLSYEEKEILKKI